MATDDELKKLIGEDVDPAPPAEEAPKEEIPKEEAPEEDPQVKAKTEQLANLDKAIVEEQGRLQKIRKDRKNARSTEDEDEDLPKINLDDPNARAWQRQIDRAAAPANQELERAKEERKLFALRQFLEDKPALSKNPSKLKAMMETYDRLKTSTELTNEGILMDLEKAYAAEHSQELISAARGARVDGARLDTMYAEPGVSRGISSYSDPKKDEKPIVLTDEEKQVLAKWGMSPAEWLETKKNFG